MTNDRGVQGSSSQVVSTTVTIAPVGRHRDLADQPRPGDTVLFNADGIQAAPGHSIVQYSWDFGDPIRALRNTASTSRASHAYGAVGSYNVLLSVLDDTGQHKTFTKTVAVGSGQPKAAFTFAVTGTHTITVDGNGSSAAGTSVIATYAWTWGDGSSTSGTSAIVSHPYGGAGTNKSRSPSRTRLAGWAQLPRPSPYLDSQLSMSVNQRLEDLRRRVQQDPSSIAFAQLAEEYRRAGQLQEAVDVCRAGLAIHPGYISARVTLGRALLDLQQLDDARQELERVLKSAPENLAAIRGLADIHHRRGALAEALAEYRAALALARNDPDLEQTVMDLAAQVEPVDPVPDDEPAYVAVESVPVRAVRIVAALEQWLQAIHVSRVERHA